MAVLPSEGGDPHRMTAVLTTVVRKNIHSRVRSLTMANCFHSRSLLSRLSCSRSRLSFFSIFASTRPSTLAHCDSIAVSFPSSEKQDDIFLMNQRDLVSSLVVSVYWYFFALLIIWTKVFSCIRINKLKNFVNIFSIKLKFNLLKNRNTLVSN